MKKIVDRKWLQKQTKCFSDIRPSYRLLVSTLEDILSQVRDRYAPLGHVSARVKTLQSFAEKAIRKQAKYRQPCDQLTDLAGGRIVTYTQAEASAICRWIEREDGLTIDWGNSLHTRRRLRTGEFGYLAAHYVVQLSSSKIMGVEVESGLRKLKCEIQVATFLQHVWAAIGHERIYKSRLRIPEQIERKTAETAALLELADTAFAETADYLDQYLTGFEASLSSEELDQEIERWEAVLVTIPKDTERAEMLCRIGGLHMAKQEFGKAYSKMKPLQESKRPDFRRELGRAADLAKKKKEARNHLERAIDINDGDWLAHKYRGDVELEEKPQAAIEWYCKAHQLAPEEPRILAPFLECELRINHNARVLQMMRGSLQAGIDECERRIDLKVHLPQAYLEQGRLALYLDPGRPYRALASYSRAVVEWRYLKLFEDELHAIERIINALQDGPDAPKLEECESRQGFVWVRDFLRVVLVAKARQVLREQRKDSLIPPELLEAAGRCDNTVLLEEIVTPQDRARPEFAEPVLIVAGGCAPESEQDVESCKGMLRKAFRGFSGTLIGGGTHAGISALTANLRRYMTDVNLLGYLPNNKYIPEEDRVHRAYKIIETRGCGYTPLGPLQTWADILNSNIAAENVRVLGVNGGELAGFEYRLALAVGAVVGVIQGTGRAAERLLPDPFWQNAHGFAPLPRDWASIAAFVNQGRQADPKLADQLLDRLARQVHESYRRPSLKKPGRLPDNLLPWDHLPETLKESNRQQVRYAVFFIRAAGFDVVPRSSKRTAKPPVPEQFWNRVEKMAEMEHGRYNAERLSTGWRLGDVNDAKRRTNPTLVPWSNLPDDTKDKDRDAVRGWPELLWKAGLRIIEPRRK